MIVPVWGLLILLGFVGEGIVGNATKLGGSVGRGDCYDESTNLKWLILNLFRLEKLILERYF
jgi:hypothetical protein